MSTAIKSNVDPAPSRGKLLYFVTEDWYFVSHRLQLAIAAKNAGYDVHVVTRVRDKADTIREAGLSLQPISVSRGRVNPVADLALIIQLIRVYRRIRPDIAHHVALKPVIYGSIASWFARVPRVVNALAGLGFLFTSRKPLARALKYPVKALMAIVLRNGRTTVILQNPDDVKGFVDSGLAYRDQIALIRGSGVDPEVFPVTDEPTGRPVVVIPCRMLWDKGVGEFVAAATVLHDRSDHPLFALVGDVDEENPASVSREQLQEWDQDDVVEWWGHSADMPAVFARSHIVCLPSYREGLPKALIEAASSGRPIVTTDAPGCREIVSDGVNGILVPVGDSESLAVALEGLLDSPALRARMGAAGRVRVLEQFSLDRIVEETLAIYNEGHDN